MGDTDNGGDYLGGGAYYGNTDGNFYDCIIVSNRANRSGGGVYTIGEVVRCVVADNQAGVGKKNSGNGGGICGLHAASKSATAYFARVVDCVVSNNSAMTSGGGVHMAVVVRSQLVGNYVNGGETAEEGLCGGGGACASVVSNSLIAANTAGKAGGGALACQLVGCQVVSNASTAARTYGGGGVVASGRVGLPTSHPCRTSVDIVNCIITNNYALEWAGGVYVDNQIRSPGKSSPGTGATNVVIVNTLIADNGGANSGCATCVRGYSGESEGVSAPTLVNCTLTKGHGTTWSAYKNVKFVNTIAWDNKGSRLENTVLAATHSCAPELTDAQTYPSSFAVDPKFKAIPGVAVYGLSARSPCREAGMPYDWMGDPDDVRSRDLAGRARLTGLYPSMGAYEYFSVGLLLIVK